MTDAELNYAKNLGKQVAKGGKLYCPLCKEELTLDYSSGDQDLSSFGDFEDTLFCPHCDTTINLVVDLNRNKGKRANFVLLGEKIKEDEIYKEIREKYKKVQVDCTKEIIKFLNKCFEEKIMKQCKNCKYWVLWRRKCWQRKKQRCFNHYFVDSVTCGDCTIIFTPENFGCVLWEKSNERL